MWCLSNLLDLVSSRPSSGLSGWSGPVSASLLVRRYRSSAGTENTSPDFCTVWMVGTWCGNFRLKATLWKNVSVKFSRLLLPKILLWSTRNSPPVPKGSWPAVAAECFDTFVVDCEASDWYLGRRFGAMGVVQRGHQMRSTPETWCHVNLNRLHQNCATMMHSNGEQKSLPRKRPERDG